MKPTTCLRFLAAAVLSVFFSAASHAQTQPQDSTSFPTVITISADAQYSVPQTTATVVFSSETWLNGARTLTGDALFHYLHDATAQYKVGTYSDAKAFMYSDVDNIVINGKRGLVAAYSQVFIAGTSNRGGDYVEQGDMNEDGVVDTQGINAEHTWPQSYFDKAYPMVADLHHLQATLVTPNARRANYPFGVVMEYTYSTICGSKLGDQEFEPCNPNKGNTARALLYFVMRYYDKSIRRNLNYKDFWSDRVPMLLEWNRMDPPDANERRRNDLVQQFQGNRNPFIDDYTLADRIGAAVLASH